ncbi:MAG: carbonic anhydrase family protein [Thermodesulfobacteriota bacterium]
MEPTKKRARTSKAHKTGKTHWSYSGRTGPANWGNLSTKYAACIEGGKQSPINLDNVSDWGLRKINFNYSPTKVNILNNGHTVQVNYDEGSTIKIGGRVYDLLQLHFHTKSEHQVNGKNYSGEMHLVHRNSHGQLAVVGVLIKKGAKNSAFGNIFASLPTSKSKVRHLRSKVNALKMLPKSGEYWTYNGSLTTPPCTEGVRWLVMKNAITMSSGQLSALKNAMHRNNRPVQPLNRRLVRGSE